MRSAAPDRGRAAPSGRVALAAAGGGIGAAVAAALAGACCVGPVAISLLGVGGAVAAAGLAPYRPFLLGASIVLLGIAFWLVHRPPRVTGVSCKPGGARSTRLVFWLAAATVALSLALPRWLA